MATVLNVELEVLTRAGDPTDHLTEKDVTQLFQLTSSDTALSTDIGAFSTSVYNYYAAQAATANVSNVEIRYRCWTGGTSVGGGVNISDGVLATPASAGDVTTAVTAIATEELSRH